MKSDDRVLVLKVKDGKKPTSVTGMIDERLFKGENNIHAVVHPNGLWYCKYELGAVPGGLKNQYFTKFSELLKFVKEYFEKRNVEVVEVRD